MPAWRRGSALLALALSIALAGCSGDSGDGAPASPSASASSSAVQSPTPTEVPTETPGGALTDAVLASTLLTTADLPAGFRVGGAEAGSADDAGCLAVTSRLNTLGAESASRVRLVAENELGAAGVLDKVYSDGDPSTLRRALNGFGAALRDCKSVDVTDDDGARTQLEVTTDRRRAAPAVDAQVNFSGSGTVTGAGHSYPYAVRYSVILVGRTLAVLAAYEVGDSSTGLAEALPRLGVTVVSRLVAAGADD